MQNLGTFTPQLTADGSFTFFSAQFGESFHSNQGAKLEAELKFVEPLQLRQKAMQPTLQLLDVCYGLGYNTAAALAAIWEVNPNCRVEWIGLEIDPTVPQAAIAQGLLQQWSSPIPHLLSQVARTDRVQTTSFQGQLLWGDARQTIQQVTHSGFQADAIFLDPFSPRTCPQLWSVEFLGLVAHCLKPEGRLATYSCSAAVRAALIAANLKIGSTVPVGRRSPGTVASFSGVGLTTLSQSEQEHLLTRAAVPYRDRDLRNSAAEIFHRREIEQQTSSLETTSHWKKRWTAKPSPLTEVSQL